MKSPLLFVRCVAVLTVMVGGTSVAAATESGWYYALGYGLSSYSSPLTDAIELADEDTTGAGFVDDTGAAWTVGLGYRINQYFGLELAYVDLGEQKFGATGDVADLPWELIDPEVNPDDLIGLGISADLNGDIHSSGALIDAFGTFPLGNFELSARVGVFVAKTKISGKIFLQDDFDPTNTGEFDFEQTASTTELMAGAGIGYTFFDHLQIRADFTFYQKVGDKQKTLETDIATITAGIAYRF